MRKTECNHDYREGLPSEDGARRFLCEKCYDVITYDDDYCDPEPVKVVTECADCGSTWHVAWDGERHLCESCYKYHNKPKPEPEPSVTMPMKMLDDLKQAIFAAYGEIDDLLSYGPNLTRQRRENLSRIRSRLQKVYVDVTSG